MTLNLFSKHSKLLLLSDEITESYLGVLRFSLYSQKGEAYAQGLKTTRAATRKVAALVVIYNKVWLIPRYTAR